MADLANRLPERLQRVIVARYGLRGQRCCKLKEVGAEYRATSRSLHGGINHNIAIAKPDFIGHRSEDGALYTPTLSQPWAHPQLSV